MSGESCGVLDFILRQTELRELGIIRCLNKSWEDKFFAYFSASLRLGTGEFLISVLQHIKMTLSLADFVEDNRVVLLGVFHLCN